MKKLKRAFATKCQHTTLFLSKFQIVDLIGYFMYSFLIRRDIKKNLTVETPLLFKFVVFKITYTNADY